MNFGKILSALYSTGEACAEGASTSSSILVAGTSGDTLPSRSRLITAFVLGAVNGLITWVSSNSLQGKWIRKYFRPEQTPDYSKATPETPEPTPEPSKQRGYAYMTINYGLILSTLIADFSSICFLYSAGKAWTNNLKTGSNDPLANINHYELLLVLCYYLLLDFPFIIFTEIAAIRDKTQKSLRIPEGCEPDKELMNKLSSIIKPLAASPYFRNTIRISGSVADMLEHIADPLLSIPPSWILRLGEASTFALAGVSLPIVILILVVSMVILARTYLFEGTFVEKILKRIASPDGEITEEEPWVNPRISRLFHQLLYLGGPLQGFDFMLPILLTLREHLAPEVAIIVAPIVFFFIGWIGNNFSEVKEAQQALKEMTIQEEDDEAREMQPTRFFSQPKPSVVVLSSASSLQAQYDSYQTFAIN